MDHNRFDDLTRAFAGSISRRQALKLLGGGLLAALVPGSVLAKGKGKRNNTCAQFCAHVFGADTPAASKCTSDAAHRKGLCYQCGPKAPSDHPQLCGQICCPDGKVCQNGTCVSPSTSVQCPADDLLGFPLGEQDTSGDPIVCGYPAFNFSCYYSATTGQLVQDDNLGLCRSSAVFM